MDTTHKLHLEQIKKQILDLKKDIPGPHYAAFDADGTLWKTDLGEIFFDYQIRKSGLRLPSDPWKHYIDTKKIDTPKAYLWLAQINNGQNISQVQKWAEDAFLEASPFPIFDFQKNLISFLHQQNIQVFIVTASVKWAVEPGGKRLGVPESRVLGVKTKVINGVVSLEQDGPITWRKGKAEALLQATQGVLPIFCAGNTLGDQHLLELSQGIRLAILSTKDDGQHTALHKAELELQDYARKVGWPTIDFS